MKPEKDAVIQEEGPAGVNPCGTAVSTEGRGHRHCLICGDRNPRSLGLRFHTDASGAVTASINGFSELSGYDGLVHGGVIASLLDAAMTHCLFSHGVVALTGDLRVRYHHPIPVESRLVLHARMVKKRGPLYHMTAELCCHGQEMARSEAVFMKKR